LRFPFAILIILCFVCCGFAQSNSKCEDFQRQIKATYNFRPSKLSAAEQTVKSKEMDVIWDAVKSNPKELAPCLRSALEAPDADRWFKFDGSVLLVVVDPSSSSKQLEAHNIAAIDLDDIDLRVWIGTVIGLALDGLDVSEAGEHWLTYPKGTYSLPEHGGFVIDNATAALFIYGSMDEQFATPALLKVAVQSNHSGRDIALSILLMQATPESARALRGIDATGLSSKGQKALKNFLEKPDVFTPRNKPKTTRDEFLSAFKKIVDGDSMPFMTLVEKVQDGEKDVVAVMMPEDIPLIRKVRRTFIARGNQHSIEYYRSFTKILTTLTLNAAVPVKTQ
jgi:hypothetical protein